MDDLFRETFFGHFVRLICHNSVLRYPEERPDFQIPSSYTNVNDPPTATDRVQSSHILGNSFGHDFETRAEQKPSRLEEAPSDSSSMREEPHNILPSKSKDGTTLVDWYTTDDPANPQNWSSLKKSFVAFQIWYEN